MKAIILSRVSTGHQDLESQTVRVKEEVIKDGYSENDIIVIEDVESATKLSEEERNGLNKMKEYIESDPQINCIYTYEISRISRQASIIYSIRDYLIKRHIQLIVINPYLKMLKDDGTISETSNLYFGLFSSMSENEGYLRKARIKKAVDKYKKEGRHTGGNTMFGYTTDSNHKYIIHKENANIVKEIFMLYVNQKMSIRAIAKEMYDRGIKFWTCKTERKTTTFLTACNNVNTILHREEYIGKKNKPRLISDGLFYEASSIMKARQICATRKEVDAVLRGMIYNKDNGYLLSANSATKFYYSKRMKGPAISFECADSIIWDWIKEKYQQYKKMNSEKMILKLEKEYKIIESKIESNFNKRRNLDEAIDRLEERIVLGNISKYKAEELENKIKNEIQESNRIYIDLQIERINIKNRMNIIENTDIDIENIEFKDKVNLIKNMIKKIYIKRISRTICEIDIISNIGESDNTKLLIDTYHKKIMQVLFSAT